MKYDAREEDLQEEQMEQEKQKEQAEKDKGTLEMAHAIILEQMNSKI